MADIAAWSKLKPRFCEVHPITLAPNYETVSECINSETALILAVHPIVNCCDIAGLVSLGAEHGVPVLFDSVESVYESSLNGKIGGFGDAECFSMHASKLLNAFEGGYVTTNDPELAHKLALLRSFGFEGQDNCVIPGALNAKLNEIHAAMALANLDELDQLVAENRLRYQRYQAGLSNVKGIRLLEFDESSATSYKNIVIELLEDWPHGRDETVAIMNTENILARAYYSPPLHLKKMDYAYISTKLPTTETLAERFMLLPCGDFVTCEDIDQIIHFLSFIGSHGTEFFACITEGKAN
jgi:dTDP-4-amino-4,6-dideoxygalactose transaminase